VTHGTRRVHDLPAPLAGKEEARVVLAQQAFLAETLPLALFLPLPDFLSFASPFLGGFRHSRDPE